MSEKLLEEVRTHRREIKHEVSSIGLSEIVNMHSSRPPEMEVQPEWQRLFRWSREQQSSFIESLILEIPVPPLFFFEDERGTWQLLDGLQRVSTILKFMNPGGGDVPPEFQGLDANDKPWHYEHQNSLAVASQLVSTEYLPSLEGLSFFRLPTSLKLNFKRYRLQVYVLKRETHRQYKYEVFKRLNRGGSYLEEQELRNCAVRILGDRFPEYIRKLGLEKNFRKSLRLSNKDLKKAQADELALRYLTMKNYGDNFRHDVARLLTRYMEQVASESIAFDYDAERDMFEAVWSTVARLNEAEKLFRGTRTDGSYAGGKLSPTQFELVSLSVAWNLEAAKGLDPPELRELLKQRVDHARDAKLTGAGSNSRTKTVGRLNLARRPLLGQ